jgi:hypothetical protein
MRLILVNFENVLGLNGQLSFEREKPLLIYGDNIAGKSNIINMLRYCLIPGARAKKGYAEEKRLKKNEILLETNSSGKVTIHFEQLNKFYKLNYIFSRKGKRVGQLQRIFEGPPVELPVEDSQKSQALQKIEWRDLDASSTRSLKEKLVEIGIYPELLDILISASNIRNFSEAISGSVVKVPEVISKRISNLHENSGKYIYNLNKLNGVLAIEKAEFDKRIKELKSELEITAKNLSEVNATTVFSSGFISKNLEYLQSTFSKELQDMPRKTSDMEKTLALLESETCDLWIKALNKIITILPKKEEIKKLLEKTNILERSQNTLKEWKTIFDQLPPDSNLENISTFKMPETKNFDFSTLSNPDRTKQIFSLTEDAKSKMQYVAAKSEEYKVLPITSQINDRIKAYESLFKVLKNPQEPTGDPALISRKNEKNLISIPLDVVLRKAVYLKGIESTPLVHRPEEIDTPSFQKQIEKIQKEIESKLAELRKIKKNLSGAKKSLKKAKQLRTVLEREAKLFETNQTKSQSRLNKIVEEWKTSLHHLCEVFNIDQQEIDLSHVDAVEPASQLISNKYSEAQTIFESSLIERLKEFPEVLKKYKGQKPEDIVKKATKEFKDAIDKMNKRQEETRKVNEWILENINQIKALENRDKTRQVMALGLTISLAIISSIHEKADIKKMIEDLADKIEFNAKEVYGEIFPEDASFSFQHIKAGQFLSAINNEPITHPSGSQRVAISVAIMLSLGEIFGLPILLDEAFDRIDVKRLRFFSEFITGIAKTPQSPQICLAGFTTFNIEKNPDVMHFVKDWRIYLVKRAKALEKNIELLKIFSYS